jgi:CBS domain-containing protein
MEQTGFMPRPVIDAERAPLGVLAARDVRETLLGGSRTRGKALDG